jgi:hypothetical protein
LLLSIGLRDGVLCFHGNMVEQEQKCS